MFRLHSVDVPRKRFDLIRVFVLIDCRGRSKGCERKGSCAEQGEEKLAAFHGVMYGLRGKMRRSLKGCIDLLAEV